MIDKLVRLDVNGSVQSVRVSAGRGGLPPVLIVQAGPGFPLLSEVRKFRDRLGFEPDLLTAYWEQRGCGPAARRDAEGVSLDWQVDDLCVVLRWLSAETGRAVILLGISLGATVALQAAAREPEAVTSVIAVSPDTHTAGSDTAVAAFFRTRRLSSRQRGLDAKLARLGAPPYPEPKAFQLRARILADLGAIERHRRFAPLLRETLFGMVAAYGLWGTVKALRNMNIIQAKLLPQLVSLDLFAAPPRVQVPVHAIFGADDPLVPASLRERLAALMTAPGSTSTVLPDAGHMVHFDQPEAVRSIVLNAARQAAPGVGIAGPGLGT